MTIQSPDPSSRPVAAPGLADPRRLARLVGYALAGAASTTVWAVLAALAIRVPI